MREEGLELPNLPTQSRHRATQPRSCVQLANELAEPASSHHLSRVPNRYAQYDLLEADELWDVWSYKAHINETGNTSYRLTQTIR